MVEKTTREAFLEQMQDVTPLPAANRAELTKPRKPTPGEAERRRAATRMQLLNLNYLREDEVPWLGPDDWLAFKKPGVQNGVYRKLRLAQYPIEARLDLHEQRVEQARQEVWQFIRDCLRYEVRSVLIVHGRGERNKDRIAVLKSYVDYWLREIPEVLAFHSAQKHHGGSGAVYVLLKKSEREKQLNRERFGSK